ncbi:MAG TPA: glycosyltransferase family 8 protein [Pseudonocardiaceae bacterium]|jgi:lipopolysaccharide biosynthesis glycosyltransferase|nr:glycosyltransferase family 8 protein [Pseudonocardiaceae bacterium]
MDIAFAADEIYAQYVPAAIESILQYHPGDSGIRFWIMTTRTGADLIRSRTEQQASGRASVTILESDESFRSLPVSDDPRLEQITTGMYLKLLLPDAVPSHVDRLLYLDVDVLCNGSLRDLWDTAIGAAVLAAVVDTGAPTVSSFDGLPGAPATMRPDDPYFNSGVLLIDVPEWSRQQVTDRCFHYIANLAEPYRFPDQDALNIATHQRWFELDRAWNHMVSFHLSDTEAYRRARIIHFAGPPKPWHANYPIAELRSRYQALTRDLAAYRS